MKVGHEVARFNNHDKTIVESVQLLSENFSSKGTTKTLWTVSRRFTPKTAAHSSSRGKVSDLTGATLIFEAIR